MIRRHPILFGLLVLIVAGIVAAVILAKRPRPLPVRLADVERLDRLESLVRASGEIRAHTMVDIQTEVAGVVVDLPVQEGQKVRKDQVLLRVDPFQAETELAGARANHAAGEAEVKRMEAAIAAAESDLARDQEQIEMSKSDLGEAEITLERDLAAQEREKQLLDTGASTQDQFEIVVAKAKVSESRAESARSRIRQTQAQMTVGKLAVEQQQALKNAAEQNLAAAAAALNRANDYFQKATIRCPIDGVIVQLNVDAGERAVPGIQSNPQATLMTIADLSIIEAEIAVDETDIVRVALGQPAKVEVDAFPDQPLNGRITDMSTGPVRTSGSDQEGKDFKVIVAVSEPPESLRVGMSCEAEITVATRENVLAIPIQALTTREVPVDEQGAYLPPQKPLKPQDKKNTEGQPEENRKDKKKTKELQGVFLRGKDNFAHYRPIKTGIMGETHVEVSEGLEEGDKIITGPLKSLRDLNEWTFIKEEVSGKPEAGS
jgi:HlyD family secretion protein